MCGRYFFSIALSVVLIFILVIHTGFGLVYSESETIPTSLKDYLNESKGPRHVWTGCEQIQVKQEIVDFYVRRDWQPVWVSDRGSLEVARELVAAVGKSELHGLFPGDYHHRCLAGWMNALEKDKNLRFSAWNLKMMELLFSLAFLRYGNHLANGKVDPASIYSRWAAERKNDKKEKVFEFLASIDTPQDVRDAFKSLTPSSHGYLASLEEVGQLREFIASGGWPVIPTGENLRKGDDSYRVPLLVNRLSLEGDLSGKDNDNQSHFFDAKLEKGVIQFQKRHGLVQDGVVGQQTLAALNRSPEERLKTVIANMERWRWLPQDLGKRHIIVNTAGFELKAYHYGQRVLDMAVIVGDEKTKTPMFSRNMDYLEINPSWNVPPGVLKKRILPKIKKDPDYLTENDFELLSGWSANSTIVDPATIDWSYITADNFPGRLRQNPGPLNAMGRIKFMFPNKYIVYLHDTPKRYLFNKPARAFSNGCVRVEKPIDLALFILKNDTSWDRTRIEQKIESGETTIVQVRDQVAVHLLYLTFWIDPEGKANYREDIYGLDELLWEALRL